MQAGLVLPRLDVDFINCILFILRDLSKNIIALRLGKIWLLTKYKRKKSDLAFYKDRQIRYKIEYIFDQPGIILKYAFWYCSTTLAGLKGRIRAK